MANSKKNRNNHNGKKKNGYSRWSTDQPVSPRHNSLLNKTEAEANEEQGSMSSRTFRILDELGSSFERQASEMYTTQTNLMNEILREYLNWSRFIISHETPFLTFDGATIISLIEKVDDKELERTIREVSYEAAVDFIKFRWRKVNFRNIVLYLDLLSSYANVGDINVAPFDGFADTNHSASMKDDGYERYEIYVRHHMGRRWSTFMALYISTLFTLSIKDCESTYEISNRSAFIYVNLKINGSSAQLNDKSAI
ncbi:MAG: hypothetical protein ACHQ1H_03870 [Nitrososphaerales archaeon]